MQIERHQTDILILGAGGAGLMAALHAKAAAPELEVMIAVKGLLGKCGSTRAAQAGCSAAMDPCDSVERHLEDTLGAGRGLARRDLARRLAERAASCIHELEGEHGCRFDRNPDGSLHLQGLVGHRIDRTVHKRDATGVEIVSRLAEQVMTRGVLRLEEHRAIALLPAEDGSGIAGALLIDIRTGAYRRVLAKAVLLATGGGPAMYLYHAATGEKACDGLAMALRLGLTVRDLEMVQFHPAGLLAGPGSHLTGTVLEAGLCSAGAHLLNGMGERFMASLHPQGERAPSDVLSRAVHREIRAGRATPGGGVWLEVRHLGPEHVARHFPGTLARCADAGFDLARGRIEVIPTALAMLGGVEFGPDGTTELPGLYVAGEDAGGVHGANALTGNGVAEALVFGGIVGESMAAWARRQSRWPEPSRGAVAAAIGRAEQPFNRPPGDLGALRERIAHTMWHDAGIVRHGMRLLRAVTRLTANRVELESTGLVNKDRAFNLAWHHWLDLDSLIETGQAMVAAAIVRAESRGAHFREDFTETSERLTGVFTRVSRKGNKLDVALVPPGPAAVGPDHGATPGEAAGTSPP